MTRSTFLPSQLGSTSSQSSLGSQVILGKDVDVNWEAAGFGPDARPDYLEKLIINITEKNGETLTKVATISINVADIIALRDQNPSNFPNPANMTVREIDVCDGGFAKKMLVVASLPYNAAP